MATRGRGNRPPLRALKNSRIVSMNHSVNVVRMVLYGGYAPGTELNPRPFGMPPFYPTLSSEQIASVLTYIRARGAIAAPPILPDDVEAGMTGPLW